MATESAPSATPGDYTVIVSRRIKPGRELDFEQAMRAFIQYAVSCPGHSGISIFRPSGGGRDYTVVDRFVNEAARIQFKATNEYKIWMSRLAELTDGDPHLKEHNALDEWFRPPLPVTAAAPPKYKTATATFIGVYPVALLLNLTLGPTLRSWPVVLGVAVSIMTMVAVLTWGVMPVISRWLRPWLYPAAT